VPLTIVSATAFAVFVVVGVTVTVVVAPQPVNPEAAITNINIILTGNNTFLSKFFIQ
jgi:hypothetical protein